MPELHQLLDTLSTHHVVILFTIIDLLAAALLIGWTGRLFVREQRQGRQLENERLFFRCAAHNPFTAQILLRRDDLFPVYTSGDLQQLTGLTLAQLRQDTERIFRLIDPVRPQKVQQELADWDGTKPLFRSFFCKDTGLWLEMSMAAVEDGYYLAAVHNITKEHAAQEELEQELTAAQSASQSKSNFLSHMSHEIRTPINGIVGMLSLARTRLEGREQAVDSCLEKAEQSSQHLLSIVNDILDMSRIEAGKIELEAKPMDLYALGDQLRSMFQKNIEAKGVRFDLRYENFTVRYVLGDQLRIMQVLVNLLSNAQKFTSKGTITVLFQQMLCQEDRVSFMVRVKDTGIGMDPAFITRIFRPFEQESIETAQKYGGSGLGMAITDQIVNLMGGKIVVDSLPGQGSSFSVYLDLPLAAQEEVDRSRTAAGLDDNATASFSFRGRRILMAEDNAINAEIAVSIFKEIEGAEVEVAQNGQEAIDLFSGHEPGYYDLILMDVQMPVLDGRTAARRIRALDRPDARSIPIFALSADAYVEDERRSIEAGMDGHFSKPIDYDLLRREIGRFFHQKGAQ